MKSTMSDATCKQGLRTSASALVLFLGLTFACLLTTQLANSQQAAQPSSNCFLWLSDLHWNPAADPLLLNKLMQEDVNHWQTILEESKATHPSAWGEDTNWPLLHSTIEAAHQAAKNPAFIVLTGDVFPHHFREQMAAALPQPLNDAAFRNLAHKTFAFVVAQVQAIAPNKPVFYTLGNNDEYCDDYAVQPSGLFLADTAPVLLQSLHASTADTSIGRDWRDAGHYDVPHPTTAQVRIIALNSVFLSGRYRSRCGDDSLDKPGKAELSWLAQHLELARSNHQKVWIITHIPPGLDGFATEREWRNGNEHTFIPLWQPDLETEWRKLLAQYRSTVTMMLAAHIHSDAFRVVDGTPSLLTPSVSPNIRQNPAFKIVEEDAAGSILNQQTWTLNNLELASEKGSTVPAKWQQEYDFNERWGTSRLDEANLTTLLSSIELNERKQTQWMRLYTVGGDRPGPPPSVSWAQFCACGYADESDFSACLRRHTSTRTAN